MRWNCQCKCRFEVDVHLIEVRVREGVNADVEAVVAIKESEDAKSCEDVRVSGFDVVVVLLVVDEVLNFQDANPEVKAVNVEDLDEGEVRDAHVDDKVLFTVREIQNIHATLGGEVQARKYPTCDVVWPLLIVKTHRFLWNRDPEEQKMVLPLSEVFNF